MQPSQGEHPSDTRVPCTLLDVTEASAGLTSTCGFGWHKKLVSKLDRVQKKAVREAELRRQGEDEMTEGSGQERARGRSNELPDIDTASSKRRGAGCLGGLGRGPWVSAAAGRLRGAGEQQEPFCVSACGDFETARRTHLTRPSRSPPAACSSSALSHHDPVSAARILPCIPPCILP